MSQAMSLGVVDIENVDASILDPMIQFEPWNIEDKHLYELYDAIKDQIPDDYDKNSIRLSGRQIFIRNRTNRGNGTRMIASSKVEEIKNWAPKDLFEITLDPYFFEEQNWGRQEKAINKWKKIISDNIDKFTEFNTEFRFEVRRRDQSLNRRVDPIFKPSKPRIRIDMQYIDDDSNIEDISNQEDEWTVSYFMIEKSIEGEKLQQIVERIIGDHNKYICRPGILILVREKPKYSHLTHAMNMMYKASVAWAKADSELTINEIFLNAIWNEFGDQTHSRMHEYLLPNYDDDYGLAHVVRNEMEKWEGIEDRPMFYDDLSDWYNIMTEVQLFLDTPPNSWPSLRRHLHRIREKIVNFLIFVFENMDGEIGDDLLRTVEGESVYDFLRKNGMESNDVSMRKFLFQMLKRKKNENSNPMFRAIRRYYHNNLGRRFELQFTTWDGK